MKQQSKKAMFAPAGTPGSVINTLNPALQNTVTDPIIVKIWAAQDQRFLPTCALQQRRARYCTAKSSAGAR
jgi:hypothetical protein